MAELFTLRCGSSTKEVRVDDWHLSVYGDEMEMSCKIVRRDRRERWAEIDFGEMFFLGLLGDHPEQYHLGKYTNGWWRTRVSIEDANKGTQYRPYKLNEGSKQYTNTCSVEFKNLPYKPVIEPEGVVTPFAILGDEDDRPIEEVKAEMKRIVEEATTKPMIKLGGKVLNTGILMSPTRVATEQPLEAEPEHDLDIEEGVRAMAEEIAEKAIREGKAAKATEEAEPKPSWTKGMEEAAEKHETKKKALTCPICGTTTTKRGKPFKSVLSVHRHVTAAHKGS